MSWLALVLALIALLVAGAALRQARQAARRPPPPPPPPPTRDEAAEARLAALAERAAEAQATVDALRSRVADLEEEGRETRREADELRRLLEALRETPPPAPAEPGPRTRVREHLAREGWEDVVLLPEAEEGVWRVEARRGGLVGKGRARVYDDGRVEVTVRGATKAFP